jgi:hypothetical protein
MNRRLNRSTERTSPTVTQALVDHCGRNEARGLSE